MKLIILDRDGTINQDRKDFVKAPDEWVPLPGALEAIARLSEAGWHIFIASNQSGLGRGLFDMASLNAMHKKMHRMLNDLGGRIDAVFFCPHEPSEACDCRKPLPGLYNQIIERTGAEPDQVHAVGDSLRDIQAAVSAGCIPHLVLTGNGRALQQRLPLPEFPSDTAIHQDLAAFADALLAAPAAA
jgi:D-glycero-D-manno-heptose 1,7-bisphosphate phosphatase